MEGGGDLHDRSLRFPESLLALLLKDLGHAALRALLQQPVAVEEVVPAIAVPGP